MRSLSTLCKSLLICFTSSTVKSTHVLLISCPIENGGKGDFTAAATGPRSPPFSKVDRGVFLNHFFGLNLTIQAEKMSGVLALLLLLALIAAPAL
jgi:hypothetical protein